MVHIMVCCGPVRRVGWVACGSPLRWDVVVMQLVEVAVVVGHQGVGVEGGGGVVMLMPAPRSLALCETRSLCGVDLCGSGPWPVCRARVLGYGGGGRRW